MENILISEVHALLNNLPYDCQNTWDTICEGDTIGIFQLESRIGIKYAQLVKPRSIEELSDLIALIRPGPLQGKLEDGKSLTEHYIKRKHGQEEVTYIHESLKPILSSTYAILTYQEQAIKIGQELAGMSLTDSDYYIRYCLAGDSIMMTSYGPRYIKDLVGLKNIQILTPEGFRYVKDIWSNGEQKLYKVKLSSGDEIKCTENHEVDTNYGWVKIKDLTNKHYLKVAKDFVYQGHNKITTKQAALFGLFLSEGCYCDSNEPKITNKDKKCIKLIKKLITDIFGRNQYKEYIDNNKVSQIYLKDKAKSFFEKNFDKLKSKYKLINNNISCGNGSITRAFCSAFFEGDGCIVKNNGSIQFDSTSIDIITKIKYMLARDGITSSIVTKNTTYKKEPYRSYSLHIGSRSSIAIFYNKYSEYIGERKKNEILDILNSRYKAENERFLVPENIYDASVRNKSLNSILGKSGGRDYKGPKTYTRCQIINNSLGDNSLQEILDSHFKYSKVVSIEEDAIEEVFDFSMENEDKPYAYVNNILVHNCIGKKKVDLMTKAKSLFINGCVNNGIPEETAEAIFQWIEACQRYSFNKSHSISFAYHAYLSAYLKTHYPKLFFSVYLKHAKHRLKPKEEVRRLIQDARMHGIDVVTPDIRMMNEEFKLINNKIYTGITDIKSIGKTHFRILEDYTAKFPHPTTFFSFLVELGVKLKSACVNLIKAGALDFYGLDRAQMEYEYRLFSDLTEKQAEKIKGCSSLLEGMNLLISSGNKTTQKKIESLRQLLTNPPHKISVSMEEIERTEIDLIGSYLTCSRLDSNNLAAAANSTITTFLSGSYKKEYIIAGIISGIRIVQTKKKEDMAFFSMEDSGGVIDVVAFPDCYNQYKHNISEDITVLIVGYKSKQNGKNLVATKILEI